MYKIVLIDDEDVVRQRMRDLIPWEELGLIMVGDAADGEKGLELIHREVPHIIFLDINMPKINGMQVTKVVRETYPHIKIILLTGYDEFSYAREALRLGVEDYILKPVTKDEVIELLKKLTEKLDKEQQEQQDIKRLTDKVRQSNELLRQRCIEELMLNEIETSLIERKCIAVDIPCDKSYYGVALIDYDHFIKGSNYDEKEVTFFAIQNIVSEIVMKKEWGLPFEIDGINGILYYTNEEQEPLETFKDRLTFIKEMIMQHLDITITIGMSQLVSSIEKIYLAYRNANEALLNRFFFGNNKIIFLEEQSIKPLQEVKTNEWILWEKKLTDCIKNRSKFSEVLEEICVKMKKLRMPLDTCRTVWNILTSSMLKKFVQIDERIIELFPDTINVMVSLNAKKTIEDIKKWVYELYDTCERYIEKQVSPNKKHVENILRFIEENYQFPDLSINMVCKEVFLSSSYLSSVFKKVTGSSFIEYLTKYRLEKAKELLKFTSLKTYEVAEKVGYIDPQYFSTLFKKQFNMTPSEYRKLNI